MTERQRRFAEEFRRSGDATAAAVRAGYSPARARRQARELLRRPEIAAAAGTSDGPEGAAADGISQARIVRELARIAFGETEVRDGDKLRALEMLTKLLPPDAGDGGQAAGVVILPEVMAAEARESQERRGAS